jgi:hypothetical protein
MRRRSVPILVILIDLSTQRKLKVSGLIKSLRPLSIEQKGFEAVEDNHHLHLHTCFEGRQMT